MLIYIHSRQLRGVSLPEINYKHVGVDFHGLSGTFEDRFMPSFLYPSTTRPMIFLPVHMSGFTHLTDGWMGLCIKLILLNYAGYVTILLINLLLLF